MPSNVIFAGRRPYAAVPSILACLDVGLIPFRLGPEGLHASPIKLYEYLAAGLPVISTPIPECMAIPEVQIAPSAEEFSGFLDVARPLALLGGLSGASPGARERERLVRPSRGGARAARASSRGERGSRERESRVWPLL